MGTSASNGGPKGAPPLLPPWYGNPSPGPPPPPDPDSQPNDQDNPLDPSEPSQNPTSPSNPPIDEQANQSIPANSATKNWGTARGALTRLSNSTGGSTGRKAGGRYVKSLGGSKAATRAAAQGIRTGSVYAGFLGSLSSNGIDQTLSNLGIGNYVGKSHEEICAAIANVLAPVGATNDEAIAREALLATIDALYSKLLGEGKDLSALETLDEGQVKETLVEYVGNYVFAKWMYELGSSVEKGNLSEQQAIALEREVKDLIIVETVERYRDISIADYNLDSETTSRIITDIFQTAYSTLEP